MTDYILSLKVCMNNRKTAKLREETTPVMGSKFTRRTGIYA